MEQKQPFYKLKRNWILGILFILLFVVVFRISKTGVLAVNLTTTGSGEVTTSLFRQGDDNTSVTKINGVDFSRHLASASYETLSKNSSGSFFAVSKVRGFLQKTSTTGQLAPEKSREFVGNNPRTCSYYVNDAFYSYYCNDSFENVILHVPATADTPTYTTKNTNRSVEGLVEGAVTANNKTYLLLRSSPNEDTSQAAHTVYVAGNSFSLTHPVPLKDLNSSGTYQAAAFQDGFLIYSEAISDYWYYDAAFKNPQHIEPPATKDNSLQRTLVGINNDTLVITRSNKSNFDNHDNPKNKIGEVKTQADIYKNGAFRTVSFSQNLDNIFTGLEPCGQNSICMVSNKQLYVYDVSGDRAKLSYTMSNVSFVYSVARQTLLLQDNRILNLDVDKASGYIDYDSGGHSFCGLQPGSSNGYTVCVSGISNVPSALYIDQTKDNTDSIDKKIDSLKKIPEVKDVSVSGHYIYITPDDGGVVYITSLKEYGHDPTKRAEAIKKIDAAIGQIGIDQSTYKIVY